MQVPVEVLSQEDVERLLEVPDRSEPHGLRDLAVLSMLYYAAATAGEVANLDVAHVQLKRKSLLLHGDGGVRRRVTMDAPLREVLSEYKRKARKMMLALAGVVDDPKAFFLANKPHRMSVQDLRQILGANVKAAGIGGTVNLNTLRLSRAWHLREQGRSPEAIQRLLGTPSRSGRNVI